MFQSSYHDGPRLSFPPRRGDMTPWGPIQHFVEIAHGMAVVSTARHGGMLLSPERLQQMPERMRSHDGWYEEDCEIAMPMLVFLDELFALKQLDETKVTRDDLVRTIKCSCNVEV